MSMFIKVSIKMRPISVEFEANKLFSMYKKGILTEKGVEDATAAHASA
jgi:hypothetical protein